MLKFSIELNEESRVVSDDDQVSEALSTMLGSKKPLPNSFAVIVYVSFLFFFFFFFSFLFFIIFFFLYQNSFSNKTIHNSHPKIQIHRKKKSVVVSAKSAEERVEWVRSLLDVILGGTEAESSQGMFNSAPQSFSQSMPQMAVIAPLSPGLPPSLTPAIRGFDSSSSNQKNQNNNNSQISLSLSPPINQEMMNQDGGETSLSTPQQLRLLSTRSQGKSHRNKHSHHSPLSPASSSSLFEYIAGQSEGEDPIVEADCGVQIIPEDVTIGQLLGEG